MRRGPRRRPDGAGPGARRPVAARTRPPTTTTGPGRDHDDPRRGPADQGGARRGGRQGRRAGRRRRGRAAEDRRGGRDARRRPRRRRGPGRGERRDRPPDLRALRRRDQRPRRRRALRAPRPGLHRRARAPRQGRRLRPAAEPLDRLSRPPRHARLEGDLPQRHRVGPPPQGREHPALHRDRHQVPRARSEALGRERHRLPLPRSRRRGLRPRQGPGLTLASGGQAGRPAERDHPAEGVLRRRYRPTLRMLPLPPGRSTVTSTRLPAIAVFHRVGGPFFVL